MRKANCASCLPRQQKTQTSLDIARRNALYFSQKDKGVLKSGMLFGTPSLLLGGEALCAKKC